MGSSRSVATALCLQQCSRWSPPPSLRQVGGSVIARADNEMHSEVGITYAALVWIEVGSSEQCTIERSMYVCH